MEIPPDSGSTEVLESVESEEKSQVRNQVGANSLTFFGPSGEWVGGYRKTNLFETDMTWAKPGLLTSLLSTDFPHSSQTNLGTGFTTFSIPLPASLPAAPDTNNATEPPEPTNVTFGICMDLNPQPPVLWTSSEGPYELADYCIQNKTRLLILLNAWLDSGVQDEDGIEEEGEGDAENNHDWQTLRYWSARLRPLWKRDSRRRGSMDTIYSGSSNGSQEGEEDVVEDEEEEEKPPSETIVVVCNRSGEENGGHFLAISVMSGH